MMEKWEDGNVRGWKIEERWKSGRIEVFSFPHLCLVERVEKWRDEKLFGLVEK